jgi:hypothetical protein
MFSQSFIVAGNTKVGKYHCTIDLLFDWFGISSMTTCNFCFYLQNRLIQTSQTGGQQYRDTPPLVFPDCIYKQRYHSNMHREPGEIKYRNDLPTLVDLLNFHNAYKNIYCSLKTLHILAIS